MVRATDAAKMLIQLGNFQSESDTDDRMTNLRLNMLLYFAQGYALSQFGVSLFPDPIEARDFGPVIPDVYDRYKRFKQNILSDDKPNGESFSDADYRILMDTFHTAKTMSTNELADMIHEQGTLWKEVHDKEINGTISNDVIQLYFTEHSFCKCSFQDAILKLKVKAYTPKRDIHGIPIIPWELAHDWSA